MNKAIRVSSIFLLFLVCSESQAQRLALPSISYIYSDTFTVYVTGKKIKSKNSDCRFNLKLASIFGDELDFFRNVSDSMLHLPFYTVYGDEGKIITEVTHLCNDQPSTEASVINALPQIPRIEALLELTSSHSEMIYLERLAKAYEEEKCFVNLYWVITKMKKLDAAAANLYFIEFRKRHNEIFLYGSVARDRAGHR
jgi:hypothetical protein